MIIAGFAGVGKTTFCNANKNAIDFVVMPFKYENLEEISKEYQGESIKAHPDLILKRDWRYDYYDALIKTQERYPDEIIVIPTDPEIMDWLDQDDIPYILVYPHWAGENEYKRRYIERGNSQDFIDLFIGNWDYWMEELTSRADVHSKKLTSEQYLSDVIDVSNGNRIIADKENYINKIRSEINSYTSKDILLEDLFFVAVNKETGEKIEFEIPDDLECPEDPIYIYSLNYSLCHEPIKIKDICLVRNDKYIFRLKRPGEKVLIKPITFSSAKTNFGYKLNVTFSNGEVQECDLSGWLKSEIIDEKQFDFEDFIVTPRYIHWNNTSIYLSTKDWCEITFFQHRARKIESKSEDEL